MADLGNILELNRCVHCGTDRPSLPALTGILKTIEYSNNSEKNWRVYRCTRCGGAILAGKRAGVRNIEEMYPEEINLEREIPTRAREYLQQALNSVSSPAGAVMLAASSIDSMLKVKKLKDGSLYSRIKEAAESNMITKEMATWAHDVRLGANEQRHADDEAPLPSSEEAMRVIDFARALATFLFVLPARVQRGIDAAKVE